MKIDDDSPPYLAQLMLRFVCEAGLRDEILDDLLEEFLSRKKRGGRKTAVTWYWRQVLLSISSLSWFRFALSAGPLSFGAILTGFVVAFVSAVGLGFAVRGLLFSSGYSESGFVLSLVPIVCAGLSSLAGSFSASLLLRRSNSLVMITIGSFVLLPHFLLENHHFEQPAMTILLTAIASAGLLAGDRLALDWQIKMKEEA